jgi:DNA-nicking Smr family endonuclease
MDIFSGANNNFRETVEFIKDSLVCNSNERKKIEEREKSIFNSPWPELEPSSNSIPNFSYKDNQEKDMKEHLKRVEDLRQEISDSHDEQKVLLQKVNDAIRKKQFPVADYYRNIIVFHRKKREEAEHEVTNLMCVIHKNTQKSSTTIDLHYHKLNEANAVLQTFLDENISRLRSIGKPFEDLHVITGRGNNSMNGISAIKNSAKAIRKARKLK